MLIHVDTTEVTAAHTDYVNKIKTCKFQTLYVRVQVTNLLILQYEIEIQYNALVWNSGRYLDSYSTKSQNPSPLQYSKTHLGD
jgi:hypothetical protein